jgi:hypothetical protein
LARRTRHLTSFEPDPGYFPHVRDSLSAERLNNVDYRLIPFEDDESEMVMHRTEWVRAVGGFADASLDYALVDCSPRGCLCAAVAPKLKSGGLLVLDNANWYIAPPANVRPLAPGSVSATFGTPSSALPQSMCWPTFIAAVEEWQTHWTSNGIQMTLVLVKP